MSKSAVTITIGDWVILTSNIYGDAENNPMWEGRYGRVYGRVVYLSYSTIEVRWDNGKKNSYRPTTLSWVWSKGSMQEEYIDLAGIDIIIMHSGEKRYVYENSKAGLYKGSHTDTTLELPEDRRKGLFNL